MPFAELPFLPIILFAAALLVLAWLSGEQAMEVQRFVYNLTGSVDHAIIVYFLLFLPGIIVHEAAHWIVAWILGLKPGKFRVWPVRKGNVVGLGSVTTRRGGPVRDSLVGIAPLLAGTLIIGLLSRYWLSTVPIESVMASNDLALWIAAFRSAFASPDALLWAYLIFAIANGMMPSKPDREPFGPVLIYLVIAAILWFVIGLPLTILSDVVTALQTPLLWLNVSLLIVIALDIATIAFLLAANTFTARR
jgi:hypothetical protein